MKIAGRVIVGGAALLLSAGAVALWLGAADGRAHVPEPAVVEAPAEIAAMEEELPEVEAPRPKTREEKRFARADRNDDGAIQMEEYLRTRRRNFDRLDADGDGKLSFEEYAKSGIDKFTGADADGNNLLDPVEFATLAPKPRASATAAKCACPPEQVAAVDDPDG